MSNSKTTKCRPFAEGKFSWPVSNFMLSFDAGQIVSDALNEFCASLEVGLSPYQPGERKETLNNLHIELFADSMIEDHFASWPLFETIINCATMGLDLPEDRGELAHELRGYAEALETISLQLRERARQMDK